MKNFVLAAIFALFTTAALAAGPSQQWRLEVSGTDEGVLEIAELELRTVKGGASVIDLFRNYTFEESNPVGSTTWSIAHNLGVQAKTTSVTIIANAVDVVAPGDWFHNTVALKLYQRTNLAYDEVEYVSGTTGGEPLTPEVGDVFYDTLLTVFSQWDGALWQPITVTLTTGALPVPDKVEADTITKIAGAGLPATGGAAANDTVEITFPEPVVGAATVRGSSFDTPSANRPGVAVPVIEGLENRPAAAIFDGNKGSWFKSKRAPTLRSPIAIQYTYWVGDSSRFPNVVEYAITAKNKVTAPKSWILMMYKDGKWVQVDQQAAMRFEAGETRVFEVK